MTNENGMVCIPRAQHEALMAAAKALENMLGAPSLIPGCVYADAKVIRERLAALRAAGILEGK